MRTQSVKTTIEYAGRVLLAPGDILIGETFSGERNYTTEATQLALSQSPLLENHGNASGSQSFTICKDFDTFELLLDYLFGLQTFADDNPLGELTISSGNLQKTFAAGLTSFRYEVTLVACYRLAASFDFLIK